MKSIVIYFVKRLLITYLPRGRVRFLDDDERAKLLKSSNAWLYPCVILTLSNGMRQGELIGLKWVNLNLKEHYIILHETKNGERRRIPLTVLAEIMKDTNVTSDAYTKFSLRNIYCLVVSGTGRPNISLSVF